MKWLLLIALLLCPVFAEAGSTLNAVSCSDVDIQAQLDLAASGDTVTIPAGECTWNDPVAVRKDITLQGAGEGVTIIHDPGTFTATNFNKRNCPLRYVVPCLPATQGFAGLLFVAYTSSNANLTRVTALTIIGPTSPSGDLGSSNYSIFVIGNGIAKFRIDHITCQPANAGVHGTERCVADYSDDAGLSYHSGLVDHVTVHAPTYGGIGFSSFTAIADGARMMTHLVELGTNKSTYYEDNTCIFTLGSGDGCWDMYDNASYVMRYNTITLASSGSHGADSGLFGSFVAEQYRNSFTNSGATQPYTGNPGRGGFQIMFDETATGNYSAGTEVDVYRAEHVDTIYTGDGVTTAFPYTFGALGCQAGVTETVIATGVRTRKICNVDYTVNVAGTVVTATSPPPSTKTWTIHRGPQGKPTFPCDMETLWDGRLGTVGQNNLGYPCFYQIGWTWAAPAGCTSDSTCGAANGTYVAANGYNPTYMVNNLLNGASYTIGLGPFAGTENYVHINTAVAPSKIEIYSDNVTNYGASCTSGAACTVGVGRGTALPTTCTTGVGFWKTNEGTWNTSSDGRGSGRLYKCTATDTWTLYYEPYTYPHPLQGAAPDPPPAGPSGPRVLQNTGTICTVTWSESAMAGLVGYHLKWGTTTGVYSNIIDKTASTSLAAHQPPRQHTFQFPVAGTYYIAVSSYSDTVADSDLSSELTCTSTGLSRTAAPNRIPR